MQSELTTAGPNYTTLRFRGASERVTHGMSSRDSAV